MNHWSNNKLFWKLAIISGLLVPVHGFAQGDKAKGWVYLDNELNGTTRKLAALRGSLLKQDNSFVVQCSYDDGKPLYVGTYADKKLRIKQGLSRYYHANGTVQAEGMMQNNQKTGVWRYWHDNKQLKDSGQYVNGHLEGTWKTWHPNGHLQSVVQFKPLFLTSISTSSGAVKKVSGSQVEGNYLLYYDNGLLEATGQYNGGKPVGQWQWYRQNGQPSTIEYYNSQGKIDSMRCYDSTGAYAGDMCSIAKPAVLKGLGNFREYVSANFVWPESVATVKQMAVVKVRFVVNTGGRIEQLRVESTERILAETVHRFIKQLPDWYPAVSHNREINWTEQIEISYAPLEKRIQPLLPAPLLSDDIE